MTDIVPIIDKPKRGRPPKHIDKDLFESLCLIMCTMEEICFIFKVSSTVLSKWCRRTYGKSTELVMAEFQAGGKASFRRMGLKLAETQPSVWIFLAKNMLGMSDNPTPISNGEESKELAKAIASASKALAKTDISKIAQIPTAAGGK